MEKVYDFLARLADGVLAAGGPVAGVLLVVCVFLGWRLVKLQDSIDADRKQASKEADERAPAFQRSADAIVETSKTTQAVYVLLSKIDGMLSTMRPKS